MDEGKYKSNGQISHKECQVTGLFSRGNFLAEIKESKKDGWRRAAMEASWKLSTKGVMRWAPSSCFLAVEDTR